MNKPVQIVAEEYARVLGRHFAATVIDGGVNDGTADHVANRLDELFEIAKAEARRVFADRAIGAPRKEG